MVYQYLVKYKRWVADVVLVLGLIGAYKGYQSYSHFEWQNISIGPGHVVAMPSFRKQ